MASGHCCRSSSAHLRRRDDATFLDIVVVERARHGEYRWLLAELPNEVHPRLISEVVHLAVALPDVLLLYIHLVRGHSHNINNGRHPSAQEFMAGEQRLTLQVGLQVDDELDGVMAPSSVAVPRTTRESSALATTMRSPCLMMDSAGQPLWTVSKRLLHQSLPYTAAHSPRRTTSKGRTSSRQVSSRHRWATPTWAPRASVVCSGFPSKKHGFIFGIGLWKWVISQIHGKILWRINVTHAKKGI
jgi:hypothetical protein